MSKNRNTRRDDGTIEYSWTKNPPQLCLRVTQSRISQSFVNQRGIGEIPLSRLNIVHGLRHMMSFYGNSNKPYADGIGWWKEKVSIPKDINIQSQLCPSTVLSRLTDLQDSIMYIICNDGTLLPWRHWAILIRRYLYFKNPDLRKSLFIFPFPLNEMYE